MKKLSVYGEHIVGSQIVKISQQIKESNKYVQNFTVGDFNPTINPIPYELREFIKEAYDDGVTNYPTSQGEISLRNVISSQLSKKGLEYNADSILIGAGARPLIYTLFKTIVESSDLVVYPVPSWNNDHYAFLHSCFKGEIECKPENSFFPTVEDIKKYIHRARLICLCSPQNPTGRVIDKQLLKDICELIVEENKTRDEHPCYLFFDQIYSDLSNEDIVHPVTVCPEIKDYTICIDGASKSLCATGIRVGWMFGPQEVIKKATEIFSHIGAWAPKPEQIGLANYMNSFHMESFIYSKKKDYKKITDEICNLLKIMKKDGYYVDYQKPDGGIYIPIYLEYVDKFDVVENYINFLINKCGIGLVPFEFFGSKENRGWFRLSIGGIDYDRIESVLDAIELAIIKSHYKQNENY
jgi:aspartate aminotransferase